MSDFETTKWHFGHTIRRPGQIFDQARSFAGGGLTSQARPQSKDPGVQVFCDDCFIGWYNYQGAVRSERLTIPILEADDPLRITPNGNMNLAATCRTIELKCLTMRRKIDEAEFTLSRDKDAIDFAFRQKHNIPANAEISREQADCSLTYRWRVFVVSLDDSELLFDLSGFTPSPD